MNMKCVQINEKQKRELDGNVCGKQSHQMSVLILQVSAICEQFV